MDMDDPMKDIMDALHKACKNGVVDKVKTLLSSNDVVASLSKSESLSVAIQHLSPIGFESYASYHDSEDCTLSYSIHAERWTFHNCLLPPELYNPKDRFKILSLLLQHGAGYKQMKSSFHIKNVPSISSRIAFYKYCLAQPEQHQQLLNFHCCRLSTQHALVPKSALKVFNLVWPLLVGSKIEEYLPPSKIARKTMKQAVDYFYQSLNKKDKRNGNGTFGETQLYTAVSRADVDSVRFLLLQDRTQVNIMCDAKLNMFVNPDEPFQIRGKETALACAFRWRGETCQGGSDDLPNIEDNISITRMDEIIDLLEDASCKHQCKNQSTVRRVYSNDEDFNDDY